MADPVKRRLILVYCAVWLSSLVLFWCFTGAADAMGYSILVLWVLLPLTTFAVSLVIGKKNLWGSRNRLAPLILGFLYMLAGYATFPLANTLAFGRINLPDLGSWLWGALLSAAGLALGRWLRLRAARKG